MKWLYTHLSGKFTLGGSWSLRWAGVGFCARRESDFTLGGRWRLRWVGIGVYAGCGWELEFKMDAI